MKTKKLIERLLLSSLLTLGAFGVCLVIGSVVVEALPTSAPDPDPGDFIAFTDDGDPFLIRQMEEPDQLEYRDLQGKLVPPLTATRWLRLALLPTTWANVDIPPWQCISDGVVPSGHWYLVEDDRHVDGRGYFVGFDSKSKRCLGYLGQSGYRQDVPPQDELFPGIRQQPGVGLRLLSSQMSTGAPMYLQSPGGIGLEIPGDHNKIYVPSEDGKLFVVDLPARSVALIYDALPFRSASLLLETTSRGAFWRVALRTDESIQVIDAEGKVQHVFSIPDSLRDESFGIALTKEGDAIFQWASPSDSLATTTSVRLFRVSTDGRTSETDVNLASVATSRGVLAHGYLPYPAPAFLAGYVGRQRIQELLRQRLEPSYRAAVTRAFHEFGVTLAKAGVIGLICCFACYRRLVRYQASRAERLVWPIFVLAFGLPGWIGFRFGRSWPVLESCPACAKQTPGSRADCVNCGAEFQAPAALGTEVFA